ncbi:MAG: VWA domain-containing protein [Microscillaceae bacterium]|nr:VWA domain-containing protein [Microscillaceae bacterium]
MERFNLLTDQSPWWVLVCFLVGASYAFVLYQKKASWSLTVNRVLAIFRFVLVTIICLLLLLNPFIRQVINSEEKPTVVFAIDNSQSIANVNDSTRIKALLNNLKEITAKLGNDDVEIDVQQLDKAVTPAQMSNIPFNAPSTNLSSLLNNIRNNYENRNLAKIVLVSDGIHNQGISPNFLNYNVPILTVALGDTTPKRDIKLQSVLANKVAYLGNEFPVVAEVEHVGYPNRVVQVYLSQNGQILDRKTVNFESEQEIKQVTFYTTAKVKGMQHYVVSVDVLDGEFTNKNNSRDVYIEVIDGKEKILVVAAAPHPDIKAIRSVIENNENYSFDLHIPGLNVLKQEKYDLVIFHQIPSIYRGGNELLAQFRDVAKWFILGAQSNLNIFNQENKSLGVVGRFGRMDQVTPVFNRQFNKFSFEGDKIAKIEKLPPIQVPFADYNVSNSTEVIMTQRVGNLDTEKPLLVIDESGSVKTAVLAGEGLWQWRMEEYALGDSHEAFDDLISKLIQYLSTKEDRRRLRVYPINAEFYDFEKVVFETEVYNEIYERVYDQKINLTLTNEKGKSNRYSYTVTEGNTRYEISGLPKGIYRYSASATVQNRAEQSSGEFTVKDLQLEALNNTADHNLLRQLAQKTEGKFYLPNQLNDLEKDLLAQRKPNIIHSTEDIAEMINLKWLFFLLLGLACLEWVTRKYQGAY